MMWTLLNAGVLLVLADIAQRYWPNTPRRWRDFVCALVLRAEFWLEWRYGVTIPDRVPPRYRPDFAMRILMSDDPARGRVEVVDEARA